MITFTIEADYVKDHSPKDLCHSCFHAVYIGTFIKYYKISQLIHTQSIAN